jgi:hypothetical protein
MIESALDQPTLIPDLGSRDAHNLLCVTKFEILHTKHATRESSKDHCAVNRLLSLLRIVNTHT